MQNNPNLCRTLIILSDRINNNSTEYIALYRKVREMINIFIEMGINTFMVNEINEVGKMILEILKNCDCDIRVEFFNNHFGLIGDEDGRDPANMLKQACFFLFIASEWTEDSLMYQVHRQANKCGKRTYMIQSGWES